MEHANPSDHWDILYVLEDDDCRSIIKQLEEPKTAYELLETCDITPSTIYRKLDLLSETPLIEEEIVIRTDGRNTTRYARTFEALQIEIDNDLEMDIAIDR